MTWRRVSIGGVEIPERSLLRLSITQTPLEDGGDSIGLDGTTRRRSHWHKSSIRIEGEGPEPPLLAGLDYSSPLDLIIERYTADDTWTEITFSVYARRPPLQSEDLRSWHGWTLECVEVDATVLHALPYTFSLGGIVPHPLSRLDFSQTLQPIVGGALLRTGSGAGRIREHWRKTEIVLAGSGWVPIDGLDALDYSTPQTLIVSRLSSIDGNGNPIYADQSYSVATKGPQHDWDMVSRLYSWSLRCEEV